MSDTSKPAPRPTRRELKQMADAILKAVPAKAPRRFRRWLRLKRRDEQLNLKENAR